MKDMLDIVYGAIRADPRLAELAGDRIYKYDFPQSANHQYLRIVITPLGPPEGSTGGSDDVLAWQYTYQVNVEGPNRKELKEAQHHVQQVMAGYLFAQMTGGLDEQLNTGWFVDARRYRGNTKIYYTDY